MIGEIDHHILVQQPSVDDPRIGRSKAFPVAQRIRVSPQADGPLGYIGRTAYQALFAGQPEFAFKVAFASAHTDLLFRSDYANPGSIWFNVFFGYYELDAPVRLWSRPLGYAGPDDGAALQVEDIVRVGKADWNYFSNHMYGVPQDAAHRYDAVDLGQVQVTDHGRLQVGPRWWDHLSLSGVQVVSAARSTRDGLDFDDPDPPWTQLWRTAFGTHPPVDIPASFPPTPMGAEFYLSFRRQYDQEYGEEVYKTFIFGGTYNGAWPDAAENARFLGLQLESLRKIVPEEKDAGFAGPRP